MEVFSVNLLNNPFLLILSLSSIIHLQKNINVVFLPLTLTIPSNLCLLQYKCLLLSS
jgi:hypothetical protein